MDLKKRLNKPRKERNKDKAKKIAERQLRVVELRLAGKSFQKIADIVGISVGQIYKDYDNAFKRVNKELTEKADHLRTVELTRLDRLLEKIEEGYKLKKRKRIYGKGKSRTTVTVKERDISLTEYVYAYVRIMDRRSKYIAGLDAPKQIEADVGDNLKEAMETARTDLLTTLKKLAGEA